MFFASQAFPGRFNSLFYQAHGLTPSEIGILFAIGNVTAIVSTPFFSVIADNASSSTRIVIWLQIIATILFSCLIFALPSIGIIPSYLRFSYILIVRSIYSFFARPVLTLVTAICVSQLKELYGDKTGPSKFGQERLWGTISWALASLLQGLFLDLTYMNVVFVYISNILLSIIFIITLLLFSVYKHQIILPTSNRCGQYEYAKNANSTAINNNDTNMAITSPSVQSDHHFVERNEQCQIEEEDENNENKEVVVNNSDRYLLIRTIHAVVLSRGLSGISFFLMVACLSMGMTVVAMLQFLYFYNELNASSLMCGISVLVTVIFEVPLFANAPLLLRKFGPVSMMTVAALTYGVRTIGYSIVPKGWYVLILEPLHGLTFAAMQTAGVAYVARFAPPGAEATGQSLFTLVRTFAGVIGVGIGGFIMQVANGRVLYFGLGCLVLTATVAFICVNVWLGSEYGQMNDFVENGAMDSDSDSGIRDTCYDEREPLVPKVSKLDAI